jgi:hypothetical protein
LQELFDMPEKQIKKLQKALQHKKSLWQGCDMWVIGIPLKQRKKISTQPPPGVVIIFYNRSPNASMSKFAQYSSYKYFTKVTNHLSHQRVWC